MERKICTVPESFYEKTEIDLSENSRQVGGGEARLEYMKLNLWQIHKSASWAFIIRSEEWTKQTRGMFFSSFESILFNPLKLIFHQSHLKLPICEYF